MKVTDVMIKCYAKQCSAADDGKLTSKIGFKYWGYFSLLTYDNQYSHTVA